MAFRKEKAELGYRCPECHEYNLTRTWNKDDKYLPHRPPFDLVMNDLFAAFGIRICKKCKARLVVVYNGSTWEYCRFSSAFSNNYDYGVFTEGMELLRKERKGK